jgi:hypothetical protein
MMVCADHTMVNKASRPAAYTMKSGKKAVNVWSHVFCHATISRSVIVASGSTLPAFQLAEGPAFSIKLHDVAWCHY